MYSNCYTYRILANGLNEQIAGSFLTNCFSTGKEELILQFQNEKKDTFQWVVKFIDGEMYHRFFLPQMKFGKKCLHQMKDISGDRVLEVAAVTHERLIWLRFQSGFTLAFAGFGRFGNVALFSPVGEPVEFFRNQAQNSKVNLFQQISESHSADDFSGKKSADLQFLSPEQKSILQNMGFDLADASGKQRIFHAFEQQLLSHRLFTDKSMDPPKLSFVQGPETEELPDGLQGLDNYASQFTSRTLFVREKAQRIRNLEKDIRHFEKLKLDIMERAEKIRNRRSYRELGDIIMSYAHSIKPGVSSAFVPDYYTGQQIRIKLDPDLNAAKNAEKYYRKAKNEGLELQNAEKNAEAADVKLSTLRENLSAVLGSDSFRSMKQQAGKEEDKAQITKPYKEVEFMGYLIWVGKNAKSNDEMLKLAAKNDLWLHARDVSGSHVIIKKQGASFPDAVVRYAAELAAKNSRAKSQKIVPVIAIERKFVTKSRNAAPGEVRVLKENLVDAHI